MTDCTIIGGGVIGLASALALQDRGLTVEVIERNEVARGASFGNCGLMAPSEIIPISKPGVMRKLPGWLLDPEGPLYVSLRGLLHDAPWLWRFLMAGNPRRVETIVDSLTTLMQHVDHDWRKLLARTNQSERLSAKEVLMFYGDESAYRADSAAWRMRTERGFGHRIMGRTELAAEVPKLANVPGYVVQLDGWYHFTDPYEMVRHLGEVFKARGGSIINATVTDLKRTHERVDAVVLERFGEHKVNRLVLAAGAWSGPLSRRLGAAIPLAHLQGVHMQLPRSGIDLDRAIYYAPGSFVITPMEGGLRIGGTIAINGPDPKSDRRRAEILVSRARKILPDLNTENATFWSGPRPFIPDSLPVISLAPKAANAILAFGHGQVGMTLGATTGELVAGLVCNEPTGIDMTPFSALRFSR